MTIVFPLTPITRHPLMEPEVWIKNLRKGIVSIDQKDPRSIFVTNNSFALLSSICGFDEIAENVLCGSILFAKTRPEFYNNLLDAFINLLRLANRSRNLERFRHLQNLCVRAIIDRDCLKIPSEIAGEIILLPLLSRQGVILAKYISLF